MYEDLIVEICVVLAKFAKNKMWIPFVSSSGAQGLGVIFTMPSNDLSRLWRIDNA